MFYGGVVVPVGARILESDTQQGFITQAVTNYLNMAGAVCLLLWMESLWHERRNGVTRREWFFWCIAAASMIVLVLAHVQMDRLLNRELTSVIDPFGRYHKLYIGVSSLQWLACLSMLFERLRAWSQAARFASDADRSRVPR